MESTVASRRSGGGLLEGLYRVFMRRTSVYATFVVAGAFVGERVVDYGVHKLWEYNNVGVGGFKLLPATPPALLPLMSSTFVYWKRFEDISVLGSRPSEE
ncbi:hypothetical protein AAC387_Pa05g2848 [Persea americana]